MKKLISVVLCLVAVLTALTSCAVENETEDNSGNVTKKEDSTPIRPADYADGDLTYSLSISDGYRTVALDVVREGAVTTASVASPESLSGVNVVYDADGMRLSVPEGEVIALTPEGSAGLAVFFDVMKHGLSKDEYISEGKYEFVSGIYDVSLMLDADGNPCLIELTSGGVKRCAEVEVR